MGNVRGFSVRNPRVIALVAAADEWPQFRTQTGGILIGFTPETRRAGREASMGEMGQVWRCRPP